MDNTTIKNGLIGVCILAFAAGTLIPSAAAEGIYKWRDSNGAVHYGDSVPPQYSRTERHVMNTQGMEVKVLPAQESNKDIARQQAAQAQARRNRQLLSTYSSIDEIKNARDQRVKALDEHISHLKATIKKLQLRLSGIQQKVSDNQPTDSQTLYIQTLQASISRNQSALKRYQSKKAQSKQHFQTTLKRFKALQAQRAQ